MAWLAKVKELMAQKDVTQADISKATGIPPANVHRILKGNGITFFKNFKKLANFFGVLPQELLGLCGKIPIVGEISDKDGFTYTNLESATPLGWVRTWCGLRPPVVARTYALKVAGDSLEPIYRDGAILFVLREGHEKIKDGDSVIYVNEENRGYLKRIRFSNSFIILENLKSPSSQPIVKNPGYTRLLDLVAGWILVEKFYDN